MYEATETQGQCFPQSHLISENSRLSFQPFILCLTEPWKKVIKKGGGKRNTETYIFVR